MDMPYRPAFAVLEQLRDADFVAVVGPTAAGKTTLIKAAAAAEPRLHMLVAGTSRPKRPGEQEGVDFYFDTRDAMRARAAAGEYVTCVHHPSGDLYTTSADEYPASKTTLLATLSSAVPLFRQLPLRSFRTIFILPPDYATWQARLNEHPLAPEQLRRRLEEAEMSLAFGLQDADVQFLVNDDLAAAVRQFTDTALGTSHQAAREGQVQARARAARQLEQLRRQLQQG